MSGNVPHPDQRATWRKRWERLLREWRERGLEHADVCNEWRASLWLLDAVDVLEEGSLRARNELAALQKQVEERDQEIERLQKRLSGLDSPYHVLVLGADRWTLEHTLACRDSGHMAECEVHRWIADWIDEVGEPDLPKGRYAVGSGSLPEALSALASHPSPEPEGE